jgi:hypothetical protein
MVNVFKLNNALILKIHGDVLLGVKTLILSRFSKGSFIILQHHFDTSVAPQSMCNVWFNNIIFIKNFEALS